jgi:superfamily II DNA or RNA helicase
VNNVAEPAVGGFRDWAFRPSYDSDDDILGTFYVPLLERARRYDRASGYFSSWGLALAARGVARFVSAGGTMRLLVGCRLGDEDARALAGGGDTLPDALVERLRISLITADDFVAHRLGVLGWLAREGRLEVRVAVALDPQGRPLAGEDPYFHEKIGIAHDAAGDAIAFTGSANESVHGWRDNFENVDVYAAWSVPAHFNAKAEQFERHWAGKMKRFRVFGLPEALRRDLVVLAPPPGDPPTADFEERRPTIEHSVLARFLLDAPRMAEAEGLAQATVGVVPFPHQAKVVERLAGLYPRSWLVADEVGLGKTISAGLALRRLLLSGLVARVLILAPKNVCRQWQDELFEKFGLWVPVLETGGFLHADGTFESTPVGANPFAIHPVLIASSHLARRRAWRPRVLEGAPYDVLVVDEAHHARRRGYYDRDVYDPNQMLRLLDEVRSADAARSLWLLTATPMQVDQIELRDLLVQIGMHSEWADWRSFERFFATLVGTDIGGWPLVARLLRVQFASGVEPESDLVAELDRLDPPEAWKVRQFHEQADPAGTVDSMTPAGRALLVRWARRHCPVGQLVTRHTRDTLRHYRDQGLLSENIADRSVRIQPIALSPAERELYEELDDLITRLLQAKGDLKGAGFVLTVYRRRLTSSWRAIEQTFGRRMANQLGIGEEDLDEMLVDEDDTPSPNALPLSPVELAEMRRFHQRLKQIQSQDSKIEQLLLDIGEARARGDGALVFTQYTDTLDRLCEALASTFPDRLATFTGDGGRRLHEGAWITVSKMELVDAFTSGACEVLLATDAASEGLNLQAVGTLINFDLPWNPMRVEQRIGRIDRIGQKHKVVRVVNYVIPGTVEDSVYRALAERIDLFHGALGTLQPILGAAEGTMQRLYNAPRSERAKALEAELARLDDDVGRLRESGIEIDDDDPMPLPTQRPSPIDLEGLTNALSMDLGLAITHPGVPSTASPSRVSHDPQDRAALVTYGHPGLAPALSNVAANEPAEPLVRIERSGVVAWARADRVPPMLVGDASELADFGEARSMGEAVRLADDAVERTIRSRQALARRALLAARGHLLDRIRHELVAAIRTGVAARIRMESTANGAMGPRTALSLLGAESSTWLSVEAVASWLHIPLDEVLAQVRPDQVVDSSTTVLRGQLTAADQQLKALFKELAALREA